MFVPEWTDKQYTGPSDNDHVLHLQGDQPESVVYVIGNRVRHMGKSYVCLENEPSGNPASNGSAWKLDPSPVPMLRDGWGNPIIFVPASGLRVRILADENKLLDTDPTHKQTRIVTSAGEIKVPTSATDVVNPAGAKPFWASAGPDGDMSTGDDNLYSFQN
jgi:hypothetical protein